MSHATGELARRSGRPVSSSVWSAGRASGDVTRRRVRVSRRATRTEGLRLPRPGSAIRRIVLAGDEVASLRGSCFTTSKAGCTDLVRCWSGRRTTRLLTVSGDPWAHGPGLGDRQRAGGGQPEVVVVDVGRPDRSPPLCVSGTRTGRPRARPGSGRSCGPRWRPGSGSGSRSSAGPPSWRRSPRRCPNRCPADCTPDRRTPARPSCSALTWSHAGTRCRSRTRRRRSHSWAEPTTG